MKKELMMLKNWTFFVFVMAFLFCGLLSPVGAEEAGQEAPKAFIEDMGRKGVGILSDSSKKLPQREAAFREILHQFFDVKAIGKFVLGKYWRSLTEDTKKEYLRLFENEIVRSYAIRFENYQGEKFHVTKSTPQNEGWVVSSEIERPEGQQVSVKWTVYQRPQGLRVFDVSVEGVSMSVTKRSEYAAIISREGGVEGLLKALRQQYP